MSKGFFVTGTDTGVGKTIVSAALISALRTNGINACGMKPVETGCKKIDGMVVPSDGAFLRKAAGMNDAIRNITPYCFETPAAPFIASGIEGRNVEIALIRKKFQGLQKKYQAVIVEGIGGIMVPLMQNYFVIDLIKELGLPVIVVARPDLGTINHTLLTVNYALKEGARVAGIILNFSSRPKDTPAERTNPSAIRKLCPVQLLGAFPHLENLKNETIQKAALMHIDTKTLLSHCLKQ